METDDVFIKETALTREKWRQSFREYCNKQYYGLWTSMMEQLRSKEADPCIWLQGPANYLFRTNGICWGVDPAFRNPVLFQQLQCRFEQDLAVLKFVLLTHGHKDHYDVELIRHLRELPIRWVVPDFLIDRFISETDMTMEKIISIQAGQRIHIEGITIEAFTGLHWDDEGKTGCHSLGYYVDTGNRRLLIPGDVREYNIAKIPCFDKVDCLFAHVWLGKENALNYSLEQYLSSFCKFMAYMKPKRIFLTHLYEVARSVSNLWTYSHCGAIMDELFFLAPETEVIIPYLGRMYRL